MSASVFSPGTVNDIETINADRTRKAQRFATPSAGQVDFTLTNFAYAVGTGSLQININGVQQFIGADFLETSNNSFRLTTGAEAEDVIDAFGLVGSPAAQAAAVSAVQAAAAADAASTSASQSAQSKVLADAAALLASNRAADALTSANTASSAAGTAATTAANNVVSTLAGQISQSQTARDQAQGYATTASGYKDQAYQYKLDAAASAASASNYAAAAGGTQLNSDWNETNPASKAFIVNKPSLTNFVNLNTNTTTGKEFTIRSAITSSIANTASGGQGANIPICISNAGAAGAAIIKLVREGQLEAYFGLDTDNVLKWGGGSYGNVSWTMYHTGNFNPANYMPVYGGVFTSNVGLLNSVYLQGKKTNGTLNALIGVTGSDEVELYTAGNNWRIRSATTNAILFNVANTGGVTSNGPVTVDVTPQNTATLILANPGTVGVQIGMYGNGGTPNKTIRALNGNFDVINNAYTASILTISDAGVLQAPVITQTSDERRKKDWLKYSPDLVDRFAEIKKIGTFRWKGTNNNSLGVGAQSLASIPDLATAVETGADGSLTVNTGSASLVLIHALCERLIALEAEVKSLKEK